MWPSSVAAQQAHLPPSNSVLRTARFTDLKYGASSSVTADAVKADVLAELRWLREGGELVFSTPPDVEPDFVAF